MDENKILIAESEPLIAADIRRSLEDIGFNLVETAATGDEALAVADRFKPGVVLMNVRLTGAVDGISAAKRLGEDHGIPVIFLTPKSDEATMNRAKSAGPFAFVSTPLSERELSAAVDLALHKHRLSTTLKSQERWLGAILESVADGIIATDMNNRVRFMNHAAEEITGWTEGEAKEHTLLEVVQSDVEDSLRSLDILPQADSPFEESIAIEKTPLHKKNGPDVQIEGTISRIRSHEGTVEGQVLAFRDVTVLQQMTETINYQASHDTLTGLSNREQFAKRLDHLIADAKRSRRVHALIYLDIDQFRVVNDTSGHVAGDELLRHTTGVIAAVVRASDFGARLGSDEFGILLEDTSPERAHYIAERLRARLNREKFVWELKTYTIAASIGVVQINTACKDIYAVLAAADDACYIAKELGGNRIQIYEDEESVILRRRGEMEWIARIKSALEEDRLRIYYQPIVPILDSGKTPKCELLLRMEGSDGELVMPADFLPAAERYNLMPAVDRWVITSAFEFYGRIASARGRNCLYCINLSGASIIDSDLLTFIRTELQRTGVPPESFCFEVTETAAIRNISTASHLISELRGMGCTFSLDDFGSGFSSFSYLKNLPVDLLKIDGSFVKDMHRDQVNYAMVKAINNLGKLMNMETVAEFVSSAPILDCLKDIGVDYAQGYEVGRPTPLTEEGPLPPDPADRRYSV